MSDCIGNAVSSFNSVAYGSSALSDHEGASSERGSTNKLHRSPSNEQSGAYSVVESSAECNVSQKDLQKNINESQNFCASHLLNSEPDYVDEIMKASPPDVESMKLRLRQFLENPVESLDVLNKILTPLFNSTDNQLKYLLLSDVIEQYFTKGDAVSFGVANRLINAILAIEVDGIEENDIKVDDIVDTLASAADDYISDSNDSIKDNVVRAILSAFLKLEKSYSSDECRDSVSDSLWNIYEKAKYNQNLSFGGRWDVIDAVLAFEQWRDECDYFDLMALAKAYCEINKPDLEKLTTVIDAIKSYPGDLDDNHDRMFQAMFIGLATQYFSNNASDASVARLMIDSVASLFESVESYEWHLYFDSDSVVFRDLPDSIKLQDALACCVNWFFYKSHPEEQLRSPSVLSELIGAMWDKGSGDYNVVELAKSVYQRDNDASKQLCIVESLLLLEEKSPIDLSSSINDINDFYLQQIKSEPEKIESLLSLVSGEDYSARCKGYIVDCIFKHFEFFSENENTVSVSNVINGYFDKGNRDQNLADYFMQRMIFCMEGFSGKSEFLTAKKIIQSYILSGDFDRDIVRSIVKQLIDFKGVDYHTEIRHFLMRLSETEETGRFSEIVLNELPDN